jgi:hypothetical protein
MAHAYNPSYSQGRDQEDCASKSAPSKQFSRTYLKKNIPHKKGWWSDSRCRPEFKPQHHTHKKRATYYMISFI